MSESIIHENGLFIFRRDLRIVDNNGLNLLNTKCKNIYTVFIFTPEQVTDKNKYKSECIEFRKQFQDPNNNMCNVQDFKITEHPDFKNYIKKDAIPCWGCNINM